MEKEQIYGFGMVRVEEMEEILNRGRVWLIDLRNEESYRKGHIRNARNYPFFYIEEWKKEIPDGVGLLLYCEHGNQSLLAARKLRGRRGFLYTLIGGYQAYSQANGKKD